MNYNGKVDTNFLISFFTLPIEVGRRGLVGLFIMYKSYGAKGRRFEPPSLFFEFSNIRNSSSLAYDSRRVTHADKEPLEPLGSIRLTLDVRVR